PTTWRLNASQGDPLLTFCSGLLHPLAWPAPDLRNQICNSPGHDLVTSFIDVSLVFVDFFSRILKHVEQAVHRDLKLLAQTHHMVGHLLVQFVVSAPSEYPFLLRERLSPTWNRLNEEKALDTQGFGAPMHQTNVFLILPQRPDFAFLWRHFIVEGKHPCIRGLDPVVFRGGRKLWCVRGVPP